MTVHVYEDAAGEWRWRIVTANNRIVGDSAEGYTRRAWCVRMARRIAGGGMTVEVDE